LALAAGAATIELAAVLLAAPTVMRAAGVPLVAAVCERMLGPLAPGGGAAGWTAAAASVLLPALALVGAYRVRRAQQALRAEPWLGGGRRHGPHRVVVLPTDQPFAASVPGPDAQIVVSEGLLAALGPDEVEAVFRHEAAHLDRGHHRYLLLAAALDHALFVVPPVRWSTEALRVAIERWADEEAAGADRASRRVLRRALVGVTAALVAEPGIAAFTAADAVAERLTALDGDAPRPTGLAHATLYAPGAALVVVAVATVIVLGADYGAVLATAGICTM
ncbi:MAG: M56 family metallopeptidase, partial [Acidimicrobiales bacterium]